MSNSLLTGATGHLSHSMGREKTHFLTANRCLSAENGHQQQVSWGVFFLSVSEWSRVEECDIRLSEWMFHSRTTRTSKSAVCTECSTWCWTYRTAQGWGRCKSFDLCRPFIPAGRLRTVESIVSGEEERGRPEGGRRQGRGIGREHVSRNKEPQGCSVWFKVNVINTPIQNRSHTQSQLGD